MNTTTSPLLSPSSPSFPSLSYSSSQSPSSAADPLPDFDMNQFLSLGDLSPRGAHDLDSLSSDFGLGPSSSPSSFTPLNPFKDSGANALLKGDSALSLADVYRAYNTPSTFGQSAPSAIASMPVSAPQSLPALSAADYAAMQYLFGNAALSNAAGPAMTAFVSPQTLDAPTPATSAGSPQPSIAASSSSSSKVGAIDPSLMTRATPSISERDGDDTDEAMHDLSDVDEEQEDEEEEEDEEEPVTKGKKRSAPASSKGRKKQAVVGSGGKAKAKRTVSGLSAASTSAKLAALNASGAALSSTIPAIAEDALVVSGSKLSLPPVPEWEDKPSPEEYKKLSSKEKRQLRNKISARNFRHRRKEYIETLEGEINARDVVIDTLQSELGSLKGENVDLRKDINLLREQWQQLISTVTANNTSSGTGVGTGKAGIGLAGLGSPLAAIEDKENSNSTKMPLSPALSNISVNDENSQVVKRVSSPLRRPNLNKDLSNDKKNTHWGAGAMGAGFVGVHTTFVPEFRFTTPESLSSKLDSPPLPALIFSDSSNASNLSNADSSSVGTPSPSSDEADDDDCTPNMNPALNRLTAEQASQLARFTAHLRGPSTGKGIHDDFFGSNPVNLNRNLVEEYRAQLWAKVRNNVAGVAKGTSVPRDSESNGNTNGSELPSSWPAGFRPAYFQSPTAPAYKRPQAPSTSSLTGKENRDVSPFSADPELESRLRDLSLAVSDAAKGGNTQAKSIKSSAESSSQPENVVQVATNSLWGKLVSAFSEAFGADSSTHDGKRSGQWQPEKVAAVVSGKAKLEVVMREKQSVASTSKAVTDVDALCKGVAGMSTNEKRGAQRRGSTCETEKA